MAPPPNSVRTDLRSTHPNYFFVKRLAEQIARGQSRDQSAEELLREETKRHRAKLGPDGSRALAHAVACYFRWLRWTKGEAPEERLEAAGRLDAKFRTAPKEMASGMERAVPEWVQEHVRPPSSWYAALQTRAPLWLRMRPGIGPSVANELGDCRKPFQALPDAWLFDSDRDIFRTEAFTEGRCEVQDMASHLVGLACAPHAGQTWWDACAGEGGKSMHLADLMENRGVLWVSDKASWRLDKLRRRAARLGLFNFRAAQWAGGPQLPTRTVFDGVLVDAPCTGLGTWHRDPWARWTTQPHDVEELAALQRTLLTNASKAVKPGGRLVYAVCTVTTLETDAVADGFEAECPAFVRAPLGLPNFAGVEASSEVSRLQVWQGPSGTNGMYLAAWQRAR